MQVPNNVEGNDLQSLSDLEKKQVSNSYDKTEMDNIKEIFKLICRKLTGFVIAKTYLYYTGN